MIAISSNSSSTVSARLLFDARIPSTKREKPSTNAWMTTLHLIRPVFYSTGITLEPIFEHPNDH